MIFSFQILRRLPVVSSYATGPTPQTKQKLTTVSVFIDTYFIQNYDTIFVLLRLLRADQLITSS